MAVPTVRSIGTMAAGTGAVSPALPSGWQEGDLFLLFIAHGNGAVTTPSGWTNIGGIGSGSSPERSGISVAWRAATASETDPVVVADTGDHTMARIMALQGADTSSPVDGFGTSNTTYSTSVNTGGATPANTTGEDRLVFAAVSTHGPDANGGGVFSSWANSALTSVTEQIDNSTDSGDGGGLGVATGIKATAGSPGTFTATIIGNYLKSQIVFSIKPSVPPTTVTVLGALTATALLKIPVVGATSVLAEAMLATASSPIAVVGGTWVQAETGLATALAPEPEMVMSVAAEPMLATATAPEPTIPSDITINAETGLATAAAPIPSIGISVLVEPPPMTATATAYPITFWVVHDAPVSTATGRMPTPTRTGPQGDTIYDEVVSEIVPPPIAVMDFDGDTGDSLLWGDSAGHSREFDGIDDATALDFPTHTDHTMVLWVRLDYDDTAEPRIWSNADGTTELYIHEQSGPDPSLYGKLTLRYQHFGTQFLYGPDITGGETHMIVIASGGTSLSLYVDGELVDTVVAVGNDWNDGTLGAFYNLAATTFFRGEMDALAVFDYKLSPQWVTELWWQGTGQGGAKTRATAPRSIASGRALAPSVSIRPVLDSWQLHDEFTDFELDTEKWEVVRGLPFIVDDQVELSGTGTTIQTRDWYTFGEWFADIDIGPIPADSDVTVNITLIAALGDEPGLPWSETHEIQMTWATYISGGRRYTLRQWDVYSNGSDDVHSYTLRPYDPVEDQRAILTSPHPRLGQNLTGYESAAYPFPGALIGEGFAPYRYVKHMYEGRVLRMVIDVDDDPSATVIIRSVNATGPTTRIVVPTGRLTTTVEMEAIAEATNATEYVGPIGPRLIRAPSMRATARLLRPPGQAQLLVENPARVTFADLLVPEWAGEARPVTTFSPKLGAFARMIEPILIGEPRDIEVESIEATATARMPAPTTGGIIPPVVGVARFSARKMTTSIRVTKMPTTIAVYELANA